MMAMGIFALAAVGITATVVQTQKISKINLVRNTAYTVAEGYLEQMKNITAEELLASLEDPENTPLPLKSITAIDGEKTEADDPLYLEQKNKRQVLADIVTNAKGGTQYMYVTVYVSPSLKDLRQEKIGLPAIELQLDFTYSAPDLDNLPGLKGTVRTLKIIN